MHEQIPIDSPTVNAVRGVTVAALNISDLYTTAVDNWTRDLTRHELIEVITLLGCLISMTTETRT